MKVTITFLFTLFAAFSAAQTCGRAGDNCGSPETNENSPCCAGLQCRGTLAPVGGNGRICQ
ncbi:hypothetical protein LX32DRAFT_643826 [Colletotrichum zoysiae]|uniref:Uncharacterized protein n=1 Tax=Colletotrichum zoysiae TaxID=1216348 RepID=A0AAD9H9D4_9PEZI|nr:hypothetical protein LX32DRAFT_643826 [Colletotrichum zoysiae]